MAITRNNRDAGVMNAYMATKMQSLLLNERAFVTTYLSNVQSPPEAVSDLPDDVRDALGATNEGFDEYYNAFMDDVRGQAQQLHAEEKADKMMREMRRL